MAFLLLAFGEGKLPVLIILGSIDATMKTLAI